MANPIAFKPIEVDPRTELQRRLESAPTEHAEALLVACDVLQAAHDKGLLDAAHGLIEAKDTIIGKLAEYAKLPQGVAGIRNVLAAAKILAALDPEVVERLARTVVSAKEVHKQEKNPPSTWELMKRATSEDGRRGLSLMTLILTGLGRALKE